MSQKNKIIEFQILSQEVKNLQEQFQNISSSIQDLQVTKNTLEELKNLKKNKGILIPLGHGIFTKGEIKNPNDLITSVGSNILVEKDLGETKEMIKENILNLSKYSEKIEEELGRNVEKMQELQKEISEQEKQ